MTTLLVPPKPVTEIVAVRPAESTAVTKPPTPRRQSFTTCSSRASTSPRFIKTMDEAAMDLASADVSPPTRIRSPTCKSCNCAGLAFLRLFSPGVTRKIRVVPVTLTLISAPESGANVMTSSLMDLIAPMRLVTELCPACPCALQGSVRQSVSKSSPAAGKQRASTFADLFIVFMPNLQSTCEEAPTRTIYKLLLSSLKGLHKRQ